MLWQRIARSVLVTIVLVSCTDGQPAQPVANVAGVWYLSAQETSNTCGKTIVDDTPLELVQTGATVLSSMGEQPLSGTVNGDQLVLELSRELTTDNCELRWTLTLRGELSDGDPNRMTGTTVFSSEGVGGSCSEPLRDCSAKGTFSAVRAAPERQPALAELCSSLPEQHLSTWQWDRLETSGEELTAVQQAEALIGQLRRGQAQIRVVDASGEPLAAEVRYRQVAHGYRFGIYRDRYHPDAHNLLSKAGFNFTTLHLNWAVTEPTAGVDGLAALRLLYGLDFLDAHGMSSKGHALLWQYSGALPEFVAQLNKQQYLAAAPEHVAAIVKAWASEVEVWEAMNEPMLLLSSYFGLSEQEVFGLINAAAKQIRSHDPGAPVLINTAGVDCSASGCSLDFFKRAVEAGVDFDVIGLQLYFNGYFKDVYIGSTPIDVAASKMGLLEQVAAVAAHTALGKEVHVSEIAFNALPHDGLGAGYWGQDYSEQLQAEYLRALYTLLFAVEGVSSMLYWDGGDASSFGILRADGTARPAFEALSDLLHSWTTAGSAETDAKGQASFDGFAGDYQVAAIVAGRCVTGTLSIAQQQQTELVLTIPE